MLNEYAGQCNQTSARVNVRIFVYLPELPFDLQIISPSHGCLVSIDPVPKHVLMLRVCDLPDCVVRLDRKPQIGRIRDYSFDGHLCVLLTLTVEALIVHEKDCVLDKPLPFLRAVLVLPDLIKILHRKVIDL